MGVPNTTTFTLQDVADVISVVNPSTDDLTECFTYSVSGKFDPSYGPGDESNLLQFRNYANLPEAVSGSTSLKDPCALSLTVTYYFIGNGFFPFVGDIVYTDAAGTTPWTGENIKIGISKYTFVNATSGEVATITAC